MFLHSKAYNYHKYAFEAFRLLSLTNGNIASLLVMIWSRTVNKRGGKLNNIAIDLCKEHMNCALKDAALGLGANVTASRIASISRAIENLDEICNNTDKELGMHPSSIHHTTHSCKR